MKMVSVPARRWYDNRERVLAFPDRWDIDCLTSPGLEMPGLTPMQIRAKIDGLVKSHKSPFDKLRANGGQVEIIDFIPFVVSLSNHKKDFCRVE